MPGFLGPCWAHEPDSHSKLHGEPDHVGDLQNFGQCLTRKASSERLVNVIKRHTASQAFENEGDGKPGATNCELPAESTNTAGRKSGSEPLDHVGIDAALK